MNLAIAHRSGGGGELARRTPVSRFHCKLTRPGALRADPLKVSLDPCTRRPAPRQVLLRLAPDAMTVLNCPVGALQQIVHPSQGPAERIVPHHRRTFGASALQHPPRPRHIRKPGSLWAAVDKIVHLAGLVRCARLASSLRQCGPRMTREQAGTLSETDRLLTALSTRSS